MGGVGETSTLLERGRVQFVAGRFVEAHEIWEAAWRAESGDRRRLLQGLIFAAGAYQKLAQGQPSGMSRLLALALDRLAGIPDGPFGLDLPRFRSGLGASLVEAARWLSGGPAPSGPAPLGVLEAGWVAPAGRATAATG